MKKSCIVCAFSAISAYLLATEVSVQPGELHTAMVNMHNATELTISGEMDVRDFKFINDSLKGLTKIDLTKARIVAFANDTAYFAEQLNYNADEIPTLGFFSSKIQSIDFPSSLRHIADGAFSGCKDLKSVTFTSNIDSLGNFCFYDCSSLGTVTIPSNIKSMGEYTFSKCGNLKTVTVETLNAKLPNYSFSNCASLSSVTLPESTVSIGDNCFSDNESLKSFTFPTGLKEIGKEAFKGVQLQELDLARAKSLNSIDAWAFCNDSTLSFIKFPASLTRIGNGAFFMNTSLENFVLSSDITEINDFLFTGAGKVNIPEVIPQNVTSIGKYAFAEWSGILNYQLPNVLEFIDDNAFQNNSNVTDISIAATSVPALGKNVFIGMDQPNTKLAVNDNMVSAFKAADQWKEFNIGNLSSTGSTEIANSLKAYFNGAILTIKANQDITETLLFDVNGRELKRNNQNNNIITIDTAEFAGNIYVVAGKLADGNKFSLKLVRK